MAFIEKVIQDTHHDRQDEELPEYIAICFVGMPHVEGYAFDKFDLICFVFISNHSCGSTPIDTGRQSCFSV